MLTALARSPVVLQFRCFGTFTLIGENDWSAKPARARGRELLQYLVAHPNGFASREVLAEAFWPELSIDEVGNRLHLAASGARASLRDALDDVDPIRCVEGAYGWHASVAIVSDVTRFTACYNDGSPAAMREAIAIYGGELFANDRAEWIVPLRVRYTSAYLTMLERLARHALSNDDHAGSLDYGLQLRAEDPGHESAARLVMHCFAKLGRRHSAIAEYDSLCRHLRRGLNVKPTAETEALRRAILSGDHEGGAR
jgi:DNA-binding SARP family transcriptional activator